MNFLQKIFRKTPAVIQVRRKQFNRILPLHEGSMSMSSVSHPSFATTAAQLRAYNTLPWVYICVKKIAEIVSSIDFLIYSVDDKELASPIDSNALSVIFKDVNDSMSMQDLMFATVANIQLTGKAYWLLNRKSEDQAPIDMFPLSPEFVTPNQGKTKLITDYTYDVMGKKTMLPLEEVLYFKKFDPEKMLNGTSPLQSLAASLNLNEAIDDFNISFFDNGAMPTVIVRTNEAMDEDEIARAKEQFVENFAGRGRQFQPHFLQDGSMDVIPPVINDSQFQEAENKLRRKTLAAFGMFPALLGIFDESQSMASVEEQDRQFYGQTIRSCLKFIENTVNERFVQKIDPKLQARFDISNVKQLQEASRGQADRLVVLVNSGIMSEDEAREELGLSGAAPVEESKGIFITDIAETKARRDKAHDQMESVTSRSRRDFEAGLGRVWERQLKFIDERLVKIDKKAFDVFIQTTKTFGVSNFPELWKDWGWTAAWEKEVEPELTQMVVGGFNVGNREAGATNTPPIRIINNVVSRLSSRIGGTEESVDVSTKRDITRVITQGIREGKDLNQIRRDVRETFKRWEDTTIEVWRARKIAQTEAFAAFNAGKTEGWKEGDPENKFEKVWTLLGVRSRQWHIDADGQQRKHDEDFSVKGEAMSHPGDWRGSADNVINCNCTVTHVRVR